MFLFIPFARSFIAPRIQKCSLQCRTKHIDRLLFKFILTFFLHLIAIYFFLAMLQKINKEKFAFPWLSKKGLLSIGAFHKHNKETKRHLTPVNKQSRLLKYILHCLHENDSSSQVLVVVLQCVLQCTYFIWASNVSLDFFFLINQFLKQWFTLFRCSIVKFDDCYKKYSKTSLSMLHTFPLQEHMYSFGK